MKNEHIAEIVSIDSFDILGEVNNLETIPIGTLLETRKYVKIVFIVLDDLLQHLSLMSFLNPMESMKIDLIRSFLIGPIICGIL